MKYLLLVFWGMAAISVKAQTLVDSIMTVKCDADSTQSYCVYLPPTYAAQHSCPAVFVFDPAARGRLAATEFRTAAKILGFMVFASNNSRNGPMISSMQAADKMFGDVFMKFRIDDAQVYLAGFSGGARVATSIALQNSSIAGVLACGAGFAQEIPTTGLPWNFAGIAGTLDFNYIELQQLRLQLDYLHSTNNLITFKGIHNWPPQSCILEGLLWLDLQHRKKYLASGDANLLKYEALMDAKIIAKPDLVDQVEIYRQLADVSRNKPVYLQKIQQLMAMKLYRDELARQQKNIGDELAYQKKIGSALYLVDRMDVELKPKSWWKAELAVLNKMLLSRSAPDSDYVARQKAYIDANGSISFDNYFRAKHYETATEYLEIAEVFDAANAMTAYRHAQLAASQGKEDEALAYLETAMKQGFKNTGLMGSEPVFQFIRGNKRYQALVKN